MVVNIKQSISHAGLKLAFEVFISIFLYQITLHPLAGVPGPLLASFTDWVTVYQTSTGYRHPDQAESHDKYGWYMFSVISGIVHLKHHEAR